MLFCNTFRRGYPNESNVVLCPADNVCAATWYQTLYGPIVTTWRGCMNIKDGGYQKCNHRSCRFLFLHEHGTYTNCDRGPSALCCCNTNLCNSDVASYFPKQSTWPCNDTTLDDIARSSESLSNGSVYIVVGFIMLVLFAVTYFALIKHFFPRKPKPSSSRVGRRISQLYSLAKQPLDMAGANFNSQDRSSWYCGKLSRKETQERLQGKTHGSFLVRDSNTCIGDYVLSVSENSKVSHYIINQKNGKLRIGEQEFHDLPELLEFYKVHYLDTTTLIQPSIKPTPEDQTVVDGPTPNGAPQHSQPQPNENVVAQFDFRSDDSEDLPFVKGEILEIIGKPEENWWTARNSKGQEGQIPVPYVKPFVPNPSNRKSMPATYQQLGQPAQNRFSMPDASKTVVYATAKMKRVPSAYDPSALAFEVGDRILVTKMNKNGQWEGRIGNRSGTFPFTHVDIIENTDRN